MNASKMLVDITMDERLDEVLARTFEQSEIPDEVQARLDRTYAALRSIPQEPLRKKRFARKSVGAVAVAAACVLFAGAAFAATNLIEMKEGDAAFFASDKNLPVFDSMEPGAKALSADVGQSATVDGVQVTLDALSCDRNVANLYLTLTKDGGFDLDGMSIYEGSKESVWARLQPSMPHLQYTITCADGTECSGSPEVLDAYMEGESVKCLMRITPEASMSEQVRIDLRAFQHDGDARMVDAFSAGLDLSSVSAPRELGSQQVVFDTQEGQKTLGIKRFTASDLATVMVVENREERWVDEDGQDVSGWPKDALHPSHVMVTDDAGNVLQPIFKSSGGYSETVFEFAGLSPEAQSVTFTPILCDDEGLEARRLDTIERIQNGEEVDDDVVLIDVSQSGAKVPTSPLGGYEITDWTVKDSAVTIMMKPYGWASSIPELIPNSVVPTLIDEWVDPETGERGWGEHTAIGYTRVDHSTGEVAQISSYYNATDEQLRAISVYRTYVLPDWVYSEDAQAARTFAFGVSNL